MPRTKQVRARPSSLAKSAESESLLKDFEYHSNMHYHKLETDFNNFLQNLENQIDLATSRIPLEIRKMTIGQLLESDLQENDSDEIMSPKNNNERLMVPPSTVKKLKKKTIKRQTAASSMDDGYVTESTTSQTKHSSRIENNRASSSSTLSSASVPSTATTKTGRTTRSSSKGPVRVPLKDNETSTRKRGSSASRMNSKMFTPAVSKPKTEYDCVTPKVKPNTPLNMLRRPKDGEMVLSMQGSPILVSAIIQERTANINVPLSNGNIISLLPNDGLRLSHMPHLDEETKRQLKTLKGHIEKVIGHH
ncbi:borealin-like [Aphidius gifuensis]|uniref:borealin-like n=1 Tax=Aphidius gifuensis TaxID=684658 RepID=UPI001CDD7D59|nr:borealin-like [Aphidius gifuensis]XP_044007538.1 borealin-like [Aphidius gifuensis]